MTLCLTLCKHNWDSVFRLDDYCKEELYFSGRTIWLISTVGIAL